MCESGEAFAYTNGFCAGVPIRVELGPKDLANNACVLARRDLPGKEAKERGVPLAAEVLHEAAPRRTRAG